VGNGQKNPKVTREDLTGEHRLGDAGQIVLACVFGAVWVADTFFLNHTTFLNAYSPLAVRIVAGAGVLLLSAYLARTSLQIVFDEVREKPEVIRQSVFGVVRHPIYLSEILFYFGILVLSTSLAAAVVWLVAIGFLHYISRCEERLLLERFGDEYKRYMHEVPMFIPRLVRKRRV